MTSAFRKVRVLRKATDSSDKPSLGQALLGPYPPYTPTGMLGLSKTGNPAPGLSCSQMGLSYARPAHSTPLSFPSTRVLKRCHHQQNSKIRKDSCLHLKKKTKQVILWLWHGQTHWQKTLLYIGGRGCMRTRQQEGHSPSPTFRAAFLSLKHCDDHPGNLAL